MDKKQNTSEPNFLEEEYPLEWHMSRNERYAFIKLLEKIKPKVSIEIGCFKGGSLQALSKFSQKVYTVDIEPNVSKALGDKFDNVEYFIGKSSKLIPEILHNIKKNKEQLEFILIDGEHTPKGVRRDIEAFLSFKPIKPIYIVFHDSFNPSCRKGILKASYKDSPYVHFVEVDFISGVFNPGKLFRQMWGGLALVVMKPQKRLGKIKISQCQKKLYNAIYWQSSHIITDKLVFLHPLFRKIKRRLIKND